MTSRTLLQQLPREVVNFAFDQLSDEIDDFKEKADYENMVFEGYNRKELDRLCEKMREKVRDLEWEVEHGERDDFTVEGLKEVRKDISSIEYRG